ncbi:MAG: hypothetical protein H6Q65_1787 [Firmicutes bacterium]|nr:hypothetical protein [Bacillota bacterium]
MPKLIPDNDQQVTDGVNLLISILIRYPEITSISFDPQTHILRQNFMLSGIPSKIEFAKVRKVLLDSIAVYHTIEGINDKTVDIQLSEYDTVAMLHIVQDVRTLSKGEIALTIALLKEHFRSSLIIETSEAFLEEELYLQDELIDNMLNNATRNNSGRRLVGIREDGRVIVYNK